MVSSKALEVMIQGAQARASARAIHGAQLDIAIQGSPGAQPTIVNISAKTRDKLFELGRLTMVPSFTADTGELLTHVVVRLIVSVMAGSLTALIARENSRAPLVAGILLLLMGVMKAGMSWQYVPIWYHVIFTAILLPLAIFGGEVINNS